MKDEFFDAFKSNCSGQSVECGCGKLHFDSNYQYDNECHDDTDRWLALEEKEPENYQSHDGSLCAVIISGVPYMPDCTCRRIESIEEIIDRNAPSVAKYLRARAANHRDFADQIDV